jgi:hypothetical protein
MAFRFATRAIAAFALLAAVAGGVRSAEDGLSVDLMQTIEDTNKSLASSIALKDGKRASSDAKELTEMFAQVEAFYVKKGDAPDAVDLAKKSRELSGQVLRSVSANDYGGATDLATNLSRTCKTCHNFYKKS